MTRSPPKARLTFSEPRKGQQLSNTDVPEVFDAEAATGLASVVLGLTSQCLADGGASAGLAMKSLATETGFDLDVAAGILQATTAIATMGDVTAEQLAATAETYEQAADDMTQQEEEQP